MRLDIFEVIYTMLHAVNLVVKFLSLQEIILKSGEHENYNFLIHPNGNPRREYVWYYEDPCESGTSSIIVFSAGISLERKRSYSHNTITAI